MLMIGSRNTSRCFPTFDTLCNQLKFLQPKPFSLLYPPTICMSSAVLCTMLFYDTTFYVASLSAFRGCLGLCLGCMYLQLVHQL